MNLLFDMEMSRKSVTTVFNKINKILYFDTVILHSGRLRAESILKASFLTEFTMLGPLIRQTIRHQGHLNFL